MSYTTVTFEELGVRDAHHWFLGMVAPRPIAFASTVDAEGRPNLAPFSYFNIFSTKPPRAIFAPVRSGRDGRMKHTADNCLATGEVCINLVPYELVGRMNVASTEYPAGVNEFHRAGLTPLASELIRAPRVAECPIQLECKVVRVEALGEVGGAGQLVHVDVLRAHVQERILDEHGHIDPHKADLVARMGGDWYCRASGAALFQLPKPVGFDNLGFDGLPEHIRHSSVLTGNQLAQLALLPALPTPGELAQWQATEAGQAILLQAQTAPQVQHLAQQLILENRSHDALSLLLVRQ